MKIETIYIDSIGHCHRTYNGEMESIETGFFIGKCDAFVEGYCYDTTNGYATIYPWKDYTELDAAQRKYERERLADAENALAIMWGGITV